MSPNSSNASSHQTSSVRTVVDEEIAMKGMGDSPGTSGENPTDRPDNTSRNLKPRHIQLIGMGGTIATGLFLQIGEGLIKGGPASLLIAFIIWCSFILAVTVSMAEMVTYLPISSPFIRFAGRYIDEAVGFAAGWNFFIYEVALATFEITACDIFLNFWTDAIPAGVVIAIMIVSYGFINLVTVKWYGELEFWAALGKVLLIVGLTCFTFVTMVGGNPARDAFGFRNWADPGAFATLFADGAAGHLHGFLGALIVAAFTIAGPDYVSMAAGEAVNPRRTLPRAYNATFYRLTAFFVLGALCVGILVPYDSPELRAARRDNGDDTHGGAAGAAGAAASPYVVAMDRLGIPVLPHIVNALLLMSAFSAGNSYVYSASRALYGLALEGKAPGLLRWCTTSKHNNKDKTKDKDKDKDMAKDTGKTKGKGKDGVPVRCVYVVLVLTLLAFLRLSADAAVVLRWFVSLVTASQLVNFAIMCLSYLRFHAALAAQGVGRDTLPYRGWGQPYTAWYGLVGTSCMVVLSGYAVFLPGRWSVTDFLFSYAMVFVFPVLVLVWKVAKRTRLAKADEVDLTQGLAEVEEHTRQYVDKPPANMAEKIFGWIFG